MLVPILFFLVLGNPTAEPLPLDENPLLLNPEMEQFLGEVIDSHAPELVKLEQLVSAVFREGALNFSYEPVTRPAIDTFTQRSGNCLSYTYMFVAMARHLGLDARFREVEVMPNWSKRGRVLVFNRHVNVGVSIGGRKYTVDLFPSIRAIEIGGRLVDDLRALAHYYNNRGADHLVMGETERALGYFEKARDTDPNADFTWANLGVAQVQLGQLEKAKTSYLQALRLDRHNLVAMGNLGELYERMGRQDEAARCFKKVENFRKKNPYYHYSLGQHAYENGDYEQSVRHYRAALQRKSKEHRFHFALADAYARLGRLEEAQKHLEKARDYAPDESGRVRYNQKLEGLAAYEAAAGLRP